MNHQLLQMLSGGLIALALAVLPTQVQGASLPMTPGARSWMAVDSNGCGITGHCIAVGNNLNVSLIDSVDGWTGFATGSTGADALHGSLSTTGPNFMSTNLVISKIDTFTLHSATISDGTTVSASASLLVEGTLTTGPTGSRAIVQAGFGDWNTASVITPGEGNRISLNSAPQSFLRTLFQNGAASSPQSISGVATFPITVTLGTPFDLGMTLRLTTFGSASADFSNTATLSFSLPGDVTISSVDGFGSAPEPVSFLLLLAPLGLVAWRNRRRS